MALEGYFTARDSELVNLAGALSQAIEDLRKIGLPPTFIFLFDEAWLAFLRQRAMLTNFLGVNYQVLPDFWAWRVDPAKGEAGWTPHRDKGRITLGPDKRPVSVTVWIPLTEATPMNGCMYILPANRDPNYGTDRENEFRIDPPAVRAIPAAPGEYLCWNQAVLHWGGQSSPFAARPRKSMALEFQRGDIAPFNQPLLGTMPNLDFRGRVVLIAKQIIQYRHMYPLTPELEATAHAMVEAARS